MFHAPFLSHADKYADFAAYGIDQNEYLDLNNIEPSLFPTSCSYSTGESNACWTGGTARIDSKLETNDGRPKCGGKTVRKRKPKKDPNEPQKPVSAYALFFRDTQAAIKGRTPNATFGEVSKIVASMWDALDGGAKNSYKQKTESAKRDYLKRLAAYRASQISQDSSGCSYPEIRNDNKGSHACEANSTSAQIGEMSLASLVALPPAKRGLTATTTLTMGGRNDYMNNGWNGTRCAVMPSFAAATNFV
uniref:TOX high mobility group box family member 3 n=1 Tax=Ascaris suum TaxID=6253 RepID=F1L365_ASCSU